MTHTCQAFVLTCIDFRFNRQIPDLLRKQGIATFDLKCDAGGVKYLVSEDKPAVRDWMLENIDIAKRLHQITEIILINHADCGAYGGSNAFASDAAQRDFQTDQLRRAKAALATRYPDLKIRTFFAKFWAEKVALEEV